MSYGCHEFIHMTLNWMLKLSWHGRYGFCFFFFFLCFLYFENMNIVPEKIE
ncbi:hypothetical protein HanRHA438_Chr09g0424221 [Helianthus annuus]|nr:hypothetical protein HanRHA438_Chr09g0424221 [Helianthus annuus]